MMKRISAYQASDGQLFDDKKECAKHQRTLNVVEGLKAIGKRIDYDTSLYMNDFNCNVIVGPEEFARFIMANADDIRLALDGKPISATEEVSQS